MKCPACGNTKKFQYFYNGWFLINIAFDEAGVLEDTETQETDVCDLQEVICSICSFVSLPEVFGTDGFEGWRAVVLKSDDRYVLLEQERIDNWHTIIEGQVYFEVGGEVYTKLWVIHHTTSVDELPEMLVDDSPAVRNSATEKMKELLTKELRAS